MMVVSDKKRGLAPDRIWLFGPIVDAKVCLTSADVVPFLPSTTCASPLFPRQTASPFSWLLHHDT